MHPNFSRPRPLVWGMVLAAGLAGTLAYGQQAQPPGPPKKDDFLPVKIDPKTGAVIVPLGGTFRFVQKDVDLALKQETPNQPPTDIQVEKEAVLTFRPDPTVPGALLLTGRAAGATKMTFFYKDAPARSYLVVVEPDLDLLRLQIRKTVPTATVDVSAGVQTQAGPVIILSGYVTSPQDADIIQRLASGFAGGAQNIINAIQVGGVQQVQIDVVVASVSRNELRSRGFDFFVNGQSFQFASIISGLIGAQPLGFAGNTSLTASPNANIQFAVVPTQFFGALRALRTEGLAKFLAEPRIVTQTGRPAFFLAGGRQAVLSASSGINGPGVAFEQIGIQLEVLPIVYGNGQIWLEINPTNRQVDQGLGIVTVFGSTPGFREQQARSAVMLESGQTFAIGGLIQNTVQASTAKVPVLGDLPFVGVAFSTITHQEQEDELVILVTPRLVHPLDCCQVPKRLPGRETRSPDDYELFLENVMEAPRGQRKVWTGKQYNAPYKCDPTIGTYPCIGNLCTGPNLGGNCGPNGHPAPAAPMTPAGHGRVTDPTAPPATLPATVPQAIPGSPVGAADPTAQSLPVSQPVVVVPEGPRN